MYCHVLPCIAMFKLYHKAIHVSVGAFPYVWHKQSFGAEVDHYYLPLDRQPKYQAVGLLYMQHETG